MAGGLGIQALAEGIETERQLDELVAAGCQLGQGFHLSRPLRPDAVEALLYGRKRLRETELSASPSPAR